MLADVGDEEVWGLVDWVILRGEQVWGTVGGVMLGRGVWKK